MTDQARSLRVLLAEGDDSARVALATRVAEIKGVDLIGSETNAADAIIAAYRSSPDVILLDLSPPDRPAPDTIRHLLRVCPGVSVALLVEQDEDVRLTPALDAGGRESILKTATTERIESVINKLGPNTVSTKS